MNTLQTIENALTQINPYDFQELCDSFLIRRNENYAIFSRSGSQAGKRNTIKGTPDTFLLFPNGKYIFVEYSTNVTKGISKLKEDIEKCLDTEKTKVPHDDILEIILCINFKLKTEDVQLLRDELAKTYIQLTIHTLDSLALDLKLHHRDLVRDYLGLPFDTGQVVSIDTFVEEYNKKAKGMSTPLDNPFLFRETELLEFKLSIYQNDFTVLTGPAGVGKTKLTIEGIKSFLVDNPTYNAFCISYKSHTLLEDLNQYFSGKNNFILFVDDANRIDHLSQILGFYTAKTKGQLKIILTARDYALQEVLTRCYEFNPKVISLNKFTDEQIKGIIESKPYEILNPDYQRVIFPIADGNPRLAIMAALLTKKEQNVYALADVSDLFEKYYFTFVRDKADFAADLNIKSLGLIAFFHSINFANKELTTGILDDFGIDYEHFIESIDLLNNLELVEIQYGHIKIPEQNLSTFFFYKAFIKDDLLSFQQLLKRYFKENRGRFKDCVIPANNTFGDTKVMNKLRPHLVAYWQQIQSDEEKALAFLDTFWYYMKEEALFFLYNLTQQLPQTDNTDYVLTYQQNDFAYNKNPIIQLFGDFFRFGSNLKDLIQLAFEFVRKRPQHVAALIFEIRAQLSFSPRDARVGFTRQQILFEVLTNGLKQNDQLLSLAFYELSKSFLAYKYQHTEGARNNAIRIYEYPIPNNQYIQAFRKNIWNNLSSNFAAFPSQSLALLNHYSRINLRINEAIMKYDLPFVLRIIEQNLEARDFEHCCYVQNQISNYNRHECRHDAFKNLRLKFRNRTYETFLIIDWNQMRDKDIFDFQGYREYEQLKTLEIRQAFIFQNEQEVQSFFTDFVHIKKIMQDKSTYNQSFDLIVDENCKQNFDIGCALLKLAINEGNAFGYVPNLVFRHQLISKEKVDYFWELLNQYNYKGKAHWQLSFFDYLDEAIINDSYTQKLIETLQSLTQRHVIHLANWQKYISHHPNFFNRTLEIILEKNKQEATRIELWATTICEIFDLLSENLSLLKNIYFQQTDMLEHFDHDGQLFVKIMEVDASFLLEYVQQQFKDNSYRAVEKRATLNFVWKVNNVESMLTQVFDWVAKSHYYFGLFDHYCAKFFTNLKDTERPKAINFLLNYVKINASDADKFNIVVSIVRENLKEIYEDILLLYLSLNHNVDDFRKISWTKNGGVYSGDVIISDLRAADWQNILNIVEKSDLGLKLIPIKQFIHERMESEVRMGEMERMRRFVRRF